MANRMKIFLAADKAKAAIVLPSSGASGTLELTADELLNLVHGLGQVHATMVADGSQPSKRNSYEGFWEITL